MNTAWVVVTDVSEANELVTTANAKLHCRVDGTDEDATMAIYRTAARQYIEALTGCRIGSQTWDYQQEDWTDEMWLPGAPLISVTSLKYFDAAGAEQTVATSDYRVDTMSAPGRVEWVHGTSFPTLQSSRALPITVRYVCGYTATTLPKPLYQAILLLTGHLFEHRQAVITGTIQTPISFAVQALCGPYLAPWREPRVCA